LLPSRSKSHGRHHVECMYYICVCLGIKIYDY
jgi:hypothetical protein